MEPDRFVTDSSLALLARRLRFLGYDVLVLSGARLEEVLDFARREGRIALTLSDRHPRRFADVRVTKVARGDTERAVRDISEGFHASGDPLSRCPGCNTALQRRHPLEASGEVPGRVLRAAPRRLSFCPGCGKWYWEGSHVDRIREWMGRALGRPWPEGGAGDDAEGARGR